MVERLAAYPIFAIKTTKQAIDMLLRRQFESIFDAYLGLELMPHFTVASSRGGARFSRRA